jgi:hypothetical protein
VGGVAVHTAKKRLLALPACSAFDLLEPAGAGATRAEATFDEVVVTATKEAGGVTVRLADAGNVDFWAVDWTHDGQVLRAGSHASRTKKGGALVLEASHSYAAPGRRRIAVQLVDSAGAESRRVIEVG